MTIDKSVWIKLVRTKENSDNMDATNAKDDKAANDATLYNFGYAPKEVIEKFQCFCYQFTTLTDAINSLLEKDVLLKYKYRFISAPVTYQMLAKPTVYDQPSLVRSAMLSLHKYMKQGRYKSVADAIEELLFAVEDSKTSSSVGINTTAQSNGAYQYTAISKVEEEALSKIADALVLKLAKFEDTSPQKRLHTSKTETGDHKEVIAIPESPKAKRSCSPREKALKAKNTSPGKLKLKKKLCEDPDYSPTDHRKCLWSKTISAAHSNPSVSFSNGGVLEETIPPVDMDTVIPLKRLLPNYKVPCKTHTVIRHTAMFDPHQASKEMFMLNQLNLVSTRAVNINSKTSSCVIDLTLGD